MARRAKNIQKNHENRSVFDVNTFFETATGKKNQRVLRLFLGPKKIGPENGLFSLFSAHGSYRGHQGTRANQKNRSVFDENAFFQTATERKSTSFRSFFFCRLGPGISVNAQTPPKTVNRDFLEKLG